MRLKRQRRNMLASHSRLTSNDDSGNSELYAGKWKSIALGETIHLEYHQSVSSGSLGSLIK